MRITQFRNNLKYVGFLNIYSEIFYTKYTSSNMFQQKRPSQDFSAFCRAFLPLEKYSIYQDRILGIVYVWFACFAYILPSAQPVMHIWLNRFCTFLLILNFFSQLCIVFELYWFMLTSSKCINMIVTMSTVAC